MNVGCIFFGSLIPVVLHCTGVGSLGNAQGLTPVSSSSQSRRQEFVLARKILMNEKNVHEALNFKRLSANQASSSTSYVNENGCAARSLLHSTIL